MVVKTKDKLSLYLTEVQNGRYPSDELTEFSYSEAVTFLQRKKDEILRKFKELFTRSEREPTYAERLEQRVTAELRKQGYELEPLERKTFFGSLMNRLVRPVGDMVYQVIKYIIGPQRTGTKDPLSYKYAPADLFLLAAAMVAAGMLQFPLAVIFLGIKGGVKFGQDVSNYVSGKEGMRESVSRGKAISRLVDDDPFS